MRTHTFPKCCPAVLFSGEGHTLQPRCWQTRSCKLLRPTLRGGRWPPSGGFKIQCVVHYFLLCSATRLEHSRQKLLHESGPWSESARRELLGRPTLRRLVSGRRATPCCEKHRRWAVAVQPSLPTEPLAAVHWGDFRVHAWLQPTVWKVTVPSASSSSPASFLPNKVVPLRRIHDLFLSSFNNCPWQTPYPVFIISYLD